jgi:hypothetical protein
MPNLRNQSLALAHIQELLEVLAGTDLIVKERRML